MKNYLYSFSVKLIDVNTKDEESLEISVCSENYDIASSEANDCLMNI